MKLNRYQSIERVYTVDETSDSEGNLRMKSDQTVANKRFIKMLPEVQQRFMCSITVFDMDSMSKLNLF